MCESGTLLAKNPQMLVAGDLIWHDESPLTRKL